MTGRANSTGTQTLTFDVENRLSQVVGTGGGYSGTATYVYDGDGNRIKKTEGGSTVVYPNKYYEKNVTSDVITSHYYLGGQQVAIKKGSTLEYLHQDSLNSSSLSTNSSGAQLSKTVFLPFGATRSSTGTLGTDQLYTGQRLDGTGLYFYNARYYDSSIGRFISPDTFVQSVAGVTMTYLPLAVSYAGTSLLRQWNQYNWGNRDGNVVPFDPQLLNRYSYARDNPLTYNDDSGNWIHIAIAAFAGAMIGFGIYAAANHGNITLKGSLISAGAGLVGGALIAVGVGAGVGAFSATATAAAGGAATATLPFAQRTVQWLYNDPNKIWHIVGQSRHAAWSRIVTLSGDPLQDYLAVQPIITRVIQSTQGSMIGYTEQGRAIWTFVSNVNGQQVFVKAVQYGTDLYQIEDAYLVIK